MARTVVCEGAKAPYTIHPCGRSKRALARREAPRQARMAAAGVGALVFQTKAVEA